MRLGVLSSMAALLAGTGLAWAQTSAPSTPPAPAVVGAPNTLPGSNVVAPPNQGPPTVVDLGSMPRMPLSETVVGPSGCTACNEGLCNDYPHRDSYRLWGSTEYILWRIKDTGVPSFNVGTSGGYLFIPTVNTFIDTFFGSATTVIQQIT